MKCFVFVCVTFFLACPSMNLYVMEERTLNNEAEGITPVVVQDKTRYKNYDVVVLQENMSDCERKKVKLQGLVK